MHNNWNDIDKMFADKLGNMEVEPPAEVWDRVTASLDGKKGRQRGVLFFRFAIAASLFLALGTAWFFAMRNPNNATRHEMTDNSIQLESTADETNALDASTSNNADYQTNAITDTKIAGTDSRLPKIKYSASTNQHKVKNDVAFATIDAPIAEQLTYMPSRAYMMNASGFPELVLVSVVTTDDLSDADKAIIAANLDILAMNEPTNKADRWSVGAKVSPAYRFDGLQRMNESKDYESIGDGFISQNNVSATYKTNVTGGFAVAYQASKKMSVQTGVSYSAIEQGGSNIPISFAGHNWIASRDDKYYSASNEYNYMAKTDQLSNSVALNTNMGIANIALPDGTVAGMSLGASELAGNTLLNYQYLQHTGYLEIPMLLRYQLIDKRLGFHLLGGFNTNLLVYNFAALANGSSIMADGHVEGLRPVTLSSSLGMGLDYGIGNRIDLSVEPMMKIQLNSLNSQYGINAKPYMLGVYTGLSYRF